MSSTPLKAVLDLSTEVGCRKTAATSLAVAFKREGLSKATPSFGTLHAAIMSDDKKDAKAREGVMYTIVAVAEACGSEAEPFIMSMMPEVLTQVHTCIYLKTV
jgi:hypothetical protein